MVQKLNVEAGGGKQEARNRGQILIISDLLNIVFGKIA